MTAAPPDGDALRLQYLAADLDQPVRPRAASVHRPRLASPRPGLTPYASRPNRMALDEMNPPLNKLRGKARYWAEQSLALDLDEADEADDDTFNRILWHAMRGDDTPYPERTKKRP